MSTRRRFLTLVPLAGGARWLRAAPATVDPGEPQAQDLGYVADAAKVDATRFPRYAPGQSCASCVLYQAPAGAPMGMCPIFQNRQVPAKAWCKSYIKRP